MIWICLDNKNEEKEMMLLNLNMITNIEKKNNVVWFNDRKKITFPTEEGATELFNNIKKLLNIS